MKQFEYEYPLQNPENRNHYFFSFDQCCWKCHKLYMTEMIKRSIEQNGTSELIMRGFNLEAPVPLPGTCITNREALEKDPSAVMFLECYPGHFPPWKHPSEASIWEAWAEEIHNQSNVNMFYNALACHRSRESFINLFGELSNDCGFWKRNPGLLEKVVTQ